MLSHHQKCKILIKLSFTSAKFDWTSFVQFEKKKNAPNEGLEPSTPWLRAMCSTDWASRAMMYATTKRFLKYSNTQRDANENRTWDIEPKRSRNKMTKRSMSLTTTKIIHFFFFIYSKAIIFHPYGTHCAPNARLMNFARTNALRLFRGIFTHLNKSLIQSIETTDEPAFQYRFALYSKRCQNENVFTFDFNSNNN